MKKRSYKRKRTSRRLVRTIKAVVNRTAETKFLDGANQFNVSSAGTIYALHQSINQGSTNADRVGSRLFLKGIYMRIRVTGDLAAATPGQTVRIVVFRGVAENGGAITAGTVIQTLNTAVTTLSPRTWASSSKYVILFDKTIVVSSGATAGDNGKDATHIITKYIKVNHNCTYSANGTTAYDGGIYIAWVGDEAAAASNPQVDQAVRLYWTDS